MIQSTTTTTTTATKRPYKKPYKSFPKKGVKGEKRDDSAKYATAKYLIIVESPSKCSKIEKYMGQDYACISSKGHLRSLNSLKSINKETYEIEFENITSKSKHIIWMRDIIRKFDKSRIVLASDNDREGEAIAWHICILFDLPVETTQRIVFSEITEMAIRNAVACPTVINMNLVYSQHARQILDVLVGFQISPLLWKFLFFDKNKQCVLSAGRCQTPALRILQEREVAAYGRRGEPPAIQYRINAFFFPQKNLSFSLTTMIDSPEKVREFMELSKTHNHCMTIGDTCKKTYSPPVPFNTSSLLQTVSNRLHISPSETMRICQTLYQDGWITYMRTESRKYCKEFLEKSQSYILKTYSEKHVGNLSLIQNEDKFPHEAIRVTDVYVKKGNLPGAYDTRTLAVYNLIWLNTVQSCMSTAIYNTVRLTMTAPKDLSYIHVLETPVFLGWCQTVNFGVGEAHSRGSGDGDGDVDVDGDAGRSEGSSSLMFYLNSRSLKSIPIERMESAVSVSTGQTHYTESALIQKLEELGIGRPSTYSSIIETIKDRNYVNKQDIEGVELEYKEYKMSYSVITETVGRRQFGNERAKLKIQSLGQIVVDFLTTHFNTIFSYDYTSRMEFDLDEIARGCINHSEICKKYNDEMLNLIKLVKKGIKKNVYTIDSEHTLMFEKYGPVICKTYKKEDGSEESVFLSVDREISIDLEKLKTQKYEISELLEKKIDLGEYEGNEILVKHGPYGDYIVCGENKYTLKNSKCKISELTRNNVLEIMGVNTGTMDDPVTRHVSKNAVLRKFTEELCIKNGRYGAYAFYKLSGEKKPQFLNIKKYKGDWKTCQTGEFLEWIDKTYGVSVQT
jgi:DNA topoisomerase-1